MKTIGDTKSRLRDIDARRVSMLVVLLLPSLLASDGRSDEEPRAETRRLAVVANISNTHDSLTRSELGRMFLRSRTEWARGERCIPIDQAGSSEIRAQFYRQVLDKSVYEMKRYWMQETMTGNAKPPVSLDSSQTVKKYINKIEGGIAYIYEDEIDDTVKVIRIVDAPEFYTTEDTPQEHSPPDDDAQEKPDQ